MIECKIFNKLESPAFYWTFFVKNLPKNLQKKEKMIIIDVRNILFLSDQPYETKTKTNKIATKICKERK